MSGAPNKSLANKQTFKFSSRKKKRRRQFADTVKKNNYSNIEIKQCCMVQNKNKKNHKFVEQVMMKTEIFVKFYQGQ